MESDLENGRSVPDEQGCFYVVCCTTKLDIKDINGFLETFYRSSLCGWPDPDPRMLLVMAETQQHYQDGNVQISGSGDFRSPFIGNTTQQIFEKLYDHKRRVHSDIDLAYSVLMDQQGVEENWVYLFNMLQGSADPDPDVPKLIRVEWKSLVQVLSGLNVATTDWERVYEWSRESPDQIVRFP